MSYLSVLHRALETIRRNDRLRVVQRDEPSGVIDFSNNDYLGLSRDPRIVAAMRETDRVGSGGSRLLGGRHHEHALLEDALAAALGRERALLFSSGYLAAAGAIGVLAQCVGRIYSDERNHASIIDAVRMSGVSKTIFPHLRVPDRRSRERAALIVTESVFSMDGDCADVGAIAEQLGADDVLLVDEAHAIGVCGPHGAGLAAALKDERIVILGTLSKALGAQGGFVAGPAVLIELLINSARTFIFDTALPPAIAAAARRALDVALADDSLRERLRGNVDRIREAVSALNRSVSRGPSPIVPVVLGSERRALDESARLMRAGILAPAIRPPTVAPGTSRLRLSVRADHSADEVTRLIEELACIGTS